GRPHPVCGDLQHQRATGAAVGAMRAAVLALIAAIAAQTTGFTPLFDGKTLDGWTAQNGAAPTFTVKDGVIRVEGTSGWLRSAKQYTDFQLQVEVRFITDNADSGVFVRAVG